MNSIGNKIQFALIGSIVFVAISALVIIFVNQLNATQNQRIIQTMTTEYSIISLTDELVKSYNDIVKNPGTKEFVTTYQDTHNQLLKVIATLKQRIISHDSQILMLGVEGTLKQVMNECDSGLTEVQNNNFLNISTHYDNANKEKDFVHDNTTGLLEKELEYLSGNELKSEQIYSVTLVMSLIFFVIIVLSMIILSRRFAKQLTGPIVDLSAFAKDIATGNFQNRYKRDIKINSDETGSLTQSVYTMVDKLMTMLDNEQKASEELKKNSTTIKQNNDELQRMNDMMVGRELKMVELKHEIEELTKKINPAS